MSHSTVLRSAMAFVVTTILSSAANAQLFRSYLDSTGLDTNPCTLPAPCRLLPAALAAVASGGEIWILDSANYNTGPVSITKSVSILAVPGVVGSVVATAGGAGPAGGHAIDIATAGVKVALRNLVIVPIGSAGAVHGINMTGGTELTVEECLIANLPGSGIFVNVAAKVRIRDTTVRGSGGAGIVLQNGARATVSRSIVSGNLDHGIAVSGTTAPTTTILDVADSTIDGNLQSGVSLDSNVASATLKVAIRDSRLVQNSNYGAAAVSTGSLVLLSVSNSVLSHNATGIGALASSTVWASGNTISDNTTFGVINSGGIFETFGNNAIRDNGANNAGNKSGTITAIPVE